MKFFLMVYGCQYNVWDAARINFMLKKIGLIESSEKEADIIFAISCSVRKSAVDRILGKIKNWQGKKIIVAGCVLDEDKPKFLKKNVVLWDSNKPEDLAELLPFKKQFSNPPIGEAGSTTHLSARQVQQFASEGSSETAYLPIMLGCNNFCSYCAVPYTRGREQSRNIDEIVNDFKKLVQKGHQEIMLLGQNVNSYKAEGERLKVKSKYKNDFARLLEELNGISGGFLISFTSNHPKDMTEEIISAVRDLQKVKKEIHLPVQSGSNKILEAMNRPYTKEKYMAVVERIKKEIPQIYITTDVIVGFPGETEKDFRATYGLLKEVNYNWVFVNKYSPRKGTAAFKLGDPIPWSEKQRRWRVLDELANKKTKVS